MSEQRDRLSTALEDRYRIERELGEGGMAMVYLAHDLKHNRDVALKVLKPELAAVVGAERFLAEIETTANLKHPHILPLFDSGEAEGFLFYVMPYVEGDSLRDRLDRERQLPVDEAVRITKAVAAALQHAHDRGVVHRDIKPANVLLQDGEPVIGDFGIALAIGAAGGARLTETGLSVGTPYYMSPEQATGDQAVGPATDIYALGAVLYEMLTGDPPYVGSTAQAVLGKIIQGAPVRATEVRASIPRNVDAAIRKALEKLPADRFQRAADFGRALDDPAFRHGVEATIDPSATRWKSAAAVLAVTTALLAGLSGWALFRSEPPGPTIRLPLATPQEHVPSEWLALTPDGTAAVVTQSTDEGLRPFLWRWQDMTRTELPGAVSAGTDPFISPSGDEVAFFDQGSLRVVPLTGGIPRTLSEDANCCGRWGEDGYIYYSPEARNIVRIPEDGGPVEEVTPVERAGSQGYFQTLPDGDAGVFTVFGTPPRIDAIRMSTGERKTLTTGARQYVTSSGHIVFGSEDGDLLAAAFDPDELELIGSPIPVVEGVGTARGDIFYALSDNGTLLYWRTARQGAQERFIWTSREGRDQVVDPDHSFEAGSNNVAWSLSPDGTRVAYQAMTDGAGEVWIKQLDRGPVARLTFDSGSDWSPIWSTGGDTVFFASDRGEGDDRDIWARRADGVGEAVLVLDTERSIADFSRSPDGEWFVYRVGAPPSRDIFAQRPGDGKPMVIAASPDFDELSPEISPDGRWIAYATDETGQYQVWVRPFPDIDAGRWQVSPGAGAAPRWSKDGSEIFFATAGGGLFSASVETDPAFRVLGVEHLVEFQAVAGTRVIASPFTSKWYDSSADGQRFLFARSVALSDEDEAIEPQLVLVQNFIEELERRLPRR